MVCRKWYLLDGSYIKILIGNLDGIIMVTKMQEMTTKECFNR